QRHRLPGRRRHRLRPVPGAGTEALRVLLFAHVDGRRRRSLVRSQTGGGVVEQWRYLTADGVEAAAGLAFDEAMLSGYARSADPTWPPTLRLYTCRSHCALVGRYQHLDAEVDLEACRRTGTAFSRRPTGGGAIVMGAGQLGVAVATRAPTDQNPRALLGRYAEGIVAGLAELGIEATFAGKNDLSVGGRKIAGLGLYVDPDGGLLFHSSVLADLDIPFMLEVLNIPAAKLGDKAVAAVA